MNKTENVELTVLCLITAGDKVLLQNRVKNDWKGYTLPGGHVEKGESFVDAVIREMTEDLQNDRRILCIAASDTKVKSADKKVRKERI